MVNIQLKFAAKNPTGSKIVAFTRNHKSYKANLTLKVKVSSFPTNLRHLSQTVQVRRYN